MKVSKNQGHLIWTQHNIIPHIRTRKEDPPTPVFVQTPISVILEAPRLGVYSGPRLATKVSGSPKAKLSVVQRPRDKNSSFDMSHSQHSG